MLSSAKSCTALSEHNSCKTHLMSMQKQVQFLVRAEGGHTTVAQRLVSHNEQLIAANRAKMISLLKCIIFCGQQDIALRGHRNEDFDPTSWRDPVENPGIFPALLRFRPDAGDSALQCEFTASHRVTYRTPRVQNEMLQCLAKYMQGEIVRKIKQAKFFFDMCRRGD